MSSSAPIVFEVKHGDSDGPTARLVVSVATVSLGPPEQPQFAQRQVHRVLRLPGDDVLVGDELASTCEVNMLSASTYCPAMLKYDCDSECGT